MTAVTHFIPHSAATSEIPQKHLEAWRVFQNAQHAYEESLKEQGILTDKLLQKLETQAIPSTDLYKLQEKVRGDRAYQQIIFWSLQTLSERLVSPVPQEKSS